MSEFFPRYNIALMPTDAILRQKITSVSQDLYLKDQYGYVLGDNGHGEIGLPHITLCQFRAPDDKAAISFFNALEIERNIIHPIMREFEIRHGTEEHVGAVWLAYKVALTEDLALLQKQIVARLDNERWVRYTDPANYAPHVTIARLKQEPIVRPSSNAIPLDVSFATRPVLGRSTENGVLLHPLLTEPQ
ncbi:MAG: hypothetical protein PHD48_06365 [Alphaproteobacteria bacterium]|nr:hypothetical protein [Alphaproteobacteria bacterium]